MAKPSARSPRITATLQILCAGLWLAACSGGGGGGSAAPAASPASPAAQTSSVTLAWSAAQGPVAGYSVFVQRGNGAYKHEADVSQTRATVYGEPGSTARVIVTAFDRSRAHGPNSPSSPQFTFPAANASSAGASAATAGASTSAVYYTAASQVSGPLASTDATSAATSSETPAAELAGGALVWQAGDGFRLTDSALAPLRSFVRPVAGAVLAGVADFDADGQGDLLWVGADGQLGYTPGSALRGTDPIAVVPMGALAAGERVIGAGDLDGDGDGDLLVADADAVRARLTAPGGAPVSVELGTIGQASLAGIADFDANGSDDVAWRTNTGSLVVWLMERGQIAESVEIEIAPDFSVLGIGDFDGDGAAEIALRDRFGIAFVVHPLAAQPMLETTDLANTAGWQGLGAVDLDADGSEELVLAGAGAIRIASLPGDDLIALDPDSPWQLVALLP